MECYKCSKDGVKIVHMQFKIDKDRNTKIAICPECKREEIVGFGKIG